MEKKIQITYFKGDTSPLIVRVKNLGFVDRYWLLKHAMDINDINYKKINLIQDVYVK